MRETIGARDLERLLPPPGRETSTEDLARLAGARVPSVAAAIRWLLQWGRLRNEGGGRYVVLEGQERPRSLSELVRAMITPGRVFFLEDVNPDPVRWTTASIRNVVAKIRGVSNLGYRKGWMLIDPGEPSPAEPGPHDQQLATDWAFLRDRLGYLKERDGRLVIGFEHRQQVRTATEEAMPEPTCPRAPRPDDLVAATLRAWIRGGAHTTVEHRTDRHPSQLRALVASGCLAVRGRGRLVVLSPPSPDVARRARNFEVMG